MDLIKFLFYLKPTLTIILYDMGLRLASCVGGCGTSSRPFKIKFNFEINIFKTYYLTKNEWICYQTF
jgi:hypothetical protein